MKGKNDSKSTTENKKHATKTSNTKFKNEDEEYDGSSSEHEVKDGKGKDQNVPKTCSAPNCSATRLPPTAYCFSRKPFFIDYLSDLL